MTTEQGPVRAAVEQLRTPQPGVRVRHYVGTDTSRIDQLEDTVDYLANYIDFLEARIVALSPKSE
ncbi:MAG: hypothetical protein ABI632_00030 [Pseudolysinimonas sp.]